MSLLDSLLLDPAPFDVWVTNRTDGVKGSGTLNDPYDGSTQAKFDSLMSGLAANTLVHLGPGTFTTQGYYDGAASGYGWQPKPAMKIIGSGIDVTTIQLAGSLPTNNVHYFAIGHALSTGTAPNQVANPVDFCEVSDLTIDCNLAIQSNPVACGAVRLFGNHVRIRRVKAINWGNKLSSNLGFVLAVIVADPDTNSGVIDAGIEDCVAMLPATSTSREVLVLHAGGKDYDATNQLESYGIGPFIRNCFVDCDSTGSLGANVSTDYHRFFRGLSISSCKGGVIEGNQIHNTWYGGPYLAKWSARSITVRNNFYKNVVTGPFLNLPAPGNPINLSPLKRLNPDPATDPTAEATTSANHPLAQGDRVLIAGASQSAFNGVFTVSAVTASNKFQYLMASRPTSDSSGQPTMKKVLGVEKLVVEANVVELATFPSGQTPAWPAPVGIQLAADPSAAAALAYVYGDVIIRENKIRYLDGLFDPSFLGYPLNVQGARNLIVRENVLESAPPGVAPLQNSLCGSVSYFNDETPAGVLVQGVQTDATPNKKYAELATNAEDAFVLAFLNKR